MNNFTIPTPVIIGGIIMAIGFAGLFLIVKSFAGGRIMRVPDGTPPDKYYREWKNAALSKKFSRGFLFVLFASLLMLLGGCSGILVGMVTS